MAEDKNQRRSKRLKPPGEIIPRVKNGGLEVEIKVNVEEKRKRDESGNNR